MDLIVKILMEEFSLKEFQVVNTIRLIDEGNTIPFIARYRKEVTGELSDEILRNLSERLEYLRNLEAKKEEVTRLIDEQEKLTSELQAAITAAKTMTELEDIYRPYRPKRRTRAIIAKEKGLEPLAVLLMEQNPDTNPESAALDYIDVEKGVETTEEALAGAMDIIAEQISDDADYRKRIRELTWRNSNLVSKAAKDEDSVYSQYYEFAEAVSKVANHRILAINRGEKEGFLSVKLELSEELIIAYLTKKVC